MKKVFKNKVVSIGLSFLLTFSLLLSNSASAQAVAGTGTNADTNISQYVQSSSALNENDIIYMVLTDRFYDGDSSNNGTLNVEYRPGNLKYTQGGDWKGLTQKLDYIKNLGVTAIWISPVSENEPLSRDKSESGYHGYFTHDYNKADPHFGSKQDLINLVSTAHSKGLKVILDAVPNHTADYLASGETSYSSSSYQPAAPFNNPNWYHHYGDITDWNDPFQVLNYDLGGLDDLNQDNPDARTAIKNAYKTWVQIPEQMECV